MYLSIFSSFYNVAKKGANPKPAVLKSQMQSCVCVMRRLMEPLIASHHGDQ